MHLFSWGIYFVAALLWGDWRNWQKYYPTYLFMLSLDFFAGIVTYNHTLWLFHSTFLLPNHTITDIFKNFIAYPGTVLLFLSRYPNDSFRRATGWIFIWITAYFLSEFIPYYFGGVTYQNGWFITWSIFHNIIMFPLLRLHHEKPSWAWGLGAVYFFFVWNYFDFNIQHFK